MLIDSRPGNSLDRLVEYAPAGELGQIGYVGAWVTESRVVGGVLAGQGIPVDGHVHFHDSRRVARTLDAALFNFSLFNDHGAPFAGVLLLAQSARERVFESLRDARSTGRWAVTSNPSEPMSLIASRQGSSILIVCGRQVRTRDGLEVLALGTCREFQDGLPIDKAVETVNRTDALAVIPWGLGKITGRRRLAVEALISSGAGKALFIGDNGSRLGVLGPPALIRKADGLGLRILPGTDPFPIAGDQQRVGRFGFLAEADLSNKTPWRSLRQWLLEREDSPHAYGQPCGLARFLRIQVGIQIYNRLAWGAGA